MTCASKSIQRFDSYGLSLRDKQKSAADFPALFCVEQQQRP